MFWASPGPASHSPFPRTAISFLFLPFLTSSPRLAANFPAGNCLSIESPGQVLSLSVTVYRGRNLHSCSFTVFASIWKISSSFTCTLGWKVSLKAAETTQTHNFWETGTHDDHLRAGRVTASFYWFCTDLLHHVGNIPFLLSIIKINLISTQRILSLWWVESFHL